MSVNQFLPQPVQAAPRSGGILKSDQEMLARVIARAVQHETKGVKARLAEMEQTVTDLQKTLAYAQAEASKALNDTAAEFISSRSKGDNE
jgi:hypothetical protein